MSVEVFSDYVCPWCYIGLRKLERALTRLGPAQRPTLVWRAFQLDPKASRSPGLTAAEAMREWYPDASQAEARVSRIVAAGREEGLDLRLDLARPVNTMDAHRLTRLATRLGLAAPAHEALFRAYHTEGLNVADFDVLVEIGQAAGIDPALSGPSLRGDEGRQEIGDDQARARALDVRSVPSLVVEGSGKQVGPVSANQPDEALIGLLEGA